MKLTYETSIATFIQFMVLSLLNILTGINSIVTECRAQDGSCVTGIFTSFVFYMLIALWFGVIWALGYLAQERRSRRLAQLLICAEGLIALIAYFNIKHHGGTLSLITSAIDLILAIWVIVLAFRLMRAKGGRIVSKQRSRRRRQRTV